MLDVRVTQTFDAATGFMIKFLILLPFDKSYHKRLPMGVTHPKTISSFLLFPICLLWILNPTGRN